MNWIEINEPTQVDQLVEESKQHPVLIFKHSTRCPLSRMVKSQLESEVQPDGLPFYYLDLLALRPISNDIESRFGIRHQSPQVLMIKDGKCVYDEDHTRITMSKIDQHLKEATESLS